MSMETELNKLLERIIEISPDAAVTARAIKMRDRLALPMQEVIDKIPGASVVDKAKRVGVSRQTIYYWIYGATRPNAKQARRIARITGYDVALIRGRALPS